MATTLPTFQNQTSDVINVPRYNMSGIDIPSTKYVTGEYYLENNTLDGISIGIPVYTVLGLTNVSSGTDPSEADIIYSYVVTAAGSGIPVSEKGAPDGVAELDGSGLIVTTQLPDLAITQVYVVNSEVEMLALAAETGDVAIRTDSSKSYILSSDSPSTLADWKELLSGSGGSPASSKTLTDDVDTPFATFPISDGEDFIGEIPYKVRAVKGTALQSLAGRVRFSSTREGSTYKFSISEVGAQTLSAATGTLTGAISINCAAGICTLSAKFNTSQISPDAFGIKYRLESVDTLTLTNIP